MWEGGKDVKKWPTLSGGRQSTHQLVQVFGLGLVHVLVVGGGNRLG